MSAGTLERFETDWLALREPRDAAARSRVLARAFLAALPRRARVADLACGRGANARYLASLGRPDLRWRLVDGDAALLAEARARLPGASVRHADLARSADWSMLRDCDGVTASALCDLVSGAWIAALVRAAARGRRPLLLTLSVDGRVAFSPPDACDGMVLDAFRRDQRRDKGFGPALGPAAPNAILRALRQRGYAVRMARSDWRPGPGDDQGDGDVLRALAAGMAAVAGPAGADWLASRTEQSAAGTLAATVGHVDILGLPTGFARGKLHAVSRCCEPVAALDS